MSGHGGNVAVLMFRQTKELGDGRLDVAGDAIGFFWFREGVL